VETPAGVVVLVVYVLVAAAVAVAVDIAARQRATAERRAAEACELAEIARMRAGLLDAVGHDLRTPLAGIKAAVTSLRQPDVSLDPDDRAALLATVEEGTDRMVALVENLLSASRSRAGVLSVATRPAAVDAVVAGAVLQSPDRHRIEVDLPDDLPPGHVDPGLLERVHRPRPGASRARVRQRVRAVPAPRRRRTRHGPGAGPGHTRSIRRGRDP
jgi:two-component system sensor histidine kinase KdpD